MTTPLRYGRRRWQGQGGVRGQRRGGPAAIYGRRGRAAEVQVATTGRSIWILNRILKYYTGRMEWMAHRK